VSLTVTDPDGATATDSRTITITNLPPMVTLSGLPSHNTAVVGAPLSLSASATDPGPADLVAGMTYTWSILKDGVPFASGTGSAIDFTPAASGTYAVSVTAGDQDGASSAAELDLITILPDETTTGLASSRSVSAWGESVTFTATVGAN